MWNEYEDVPEPAVPRYKSLCDGGDADYRYRYCSNLLTVAIPPDTLRHRQTQNAPVWLSGRLNSHRHTRHDNTVLSASCLAWRCECAMHFDGAEQPLKLSLPLQGNPGPQLIVLAPHPSQQRKRHLDRFIRFCRTHGCVQLTDAQTHHATSAAGGRISAPRACDAA